jgi:hypothetical protein
VTGPDALVGKVLPHAIKAIRELGKPATQDRLVACLKRYREIPKLTWRQRGRLTKATARYLYCAVVHRWHGA